MFNMKRELANFKNHKAKFTDHGNIKILDFKEPDSPHYRIRFLFEEDYCKLHISGDLGELIASNYSNMTYEKFPEHFVNNVGYFEEKIDCHNRKIYVYDEEEAKKDIKKQLEEYDCVEKILTHDRYDFETDEDKWNEFFDGLFIDFSSENGIGPRGYDLLSEYIEEPWEFSDTAGKRYTGILELYMLAFKLAQKQLQEGEKRDVK